MSKITTWVVSDWHFNHANIIKYCDRPFTSTEEMTRVIIENHNAVVQPNDLVFVLGDVGMGDIPVSCLNGTKILIRGNHDKLSVTKYLNIGFTAVLQSADVKVGKTLVHLRHVPTRTRSEFVCIARKLIWKMLKKRRTPKAILQQVHREWRWYNKPKGRPVICGHVHNSWVVRGENINVSVEMTDYYPVKLHDVVATYLINKKT